MRFLNLDHTQETISRLVTALHGCEPMPDELDTSYRRVISKMRVLPAPPVGTEVQFRQGPWGQHLEKGRTFEHLVEGLADTEAHQEMEWFRQLEAAIAHTEELSAGLGALVNLVVTDIVCFSSKNKGSASASHLPGLVSMSPGDSWQVYDFADSLVRQAVHLNVYLADMAYRLYTKPVRELAGDEHRVVSAVNAGHMRPLDQAFHSGAVVPPLMLMQARRGKTDRVDQLRDSLRECTDGLMDKLGQFTPYGQLLVQELREFTDSYDLDLVAESVSGERFAHYDMSAA
ncbi:hypothetical protein [Streptomyces sp. NBC_00690]|uniref:hypothetical protein n=1 Tax=Streptomyces sp. NBC_00690 TaxID=2975808 RepID=UPI002E2B0200|nr:hypothetical protein [Streptomyces sp. NBC_00690]